MSHVGYPAGGPSRGFGGALDHTIGQGVTGLSTLTAGSPIAAAVES